MRQYLDLLQHILDNGTVKTDRTSVGTTSVFGPQMRFNLQDGFPLVTTKKVHLKSIIHELLWFLKGDTNIAYLKEHGVKIWDEWSDVNGDLGPIYSAQWRSWPDGQGGHIDQISQIIQQLKTQPDSRRIIVSAWNVADIPKMSLPACHALFQFYTQPLNIQERRGIERLKHPTILRFAPLQEKALDALNIPKLRLSCQLYQRSADMFLGVPFNIASYALLTQMVAQVTNMALGEFIWTGGDTHIYSNHIEQAKLQLTREPLPLPTMKLNPLVTDLFSFTYEDFTLENYVSHPGIKAPVAV